MIPVLKASGNPWDMGHAIGSQISKSLRAVVERFDQRTVVELGEGRLTAKVEP